MKALFAVGYKWTVGYETFFAHTVVTAESQEAAEANFQRLGKHYKVLPIERWKKERDATRRSATKAP